MFLDTSIIIEIFQSKSEFEEIYEIIKDEPLFISIVQIGEIADWCVKNKINPTERIEKLKHIINIIPLSEKICITGSQIKHDMREKGVTKFGLLDGIVLASARLINQELLTTDTDFKKAKDATVLK